MASSKERLRWERWYDSVMDRFRRQGQTIERLVFIVMESRAALEEIKAMGDEARMEGTASKVAARAVERAAVAIERINDPAAATLADAEELVAEGEPEDPRRKY